ncbi:hypothetical protein BJX70DRAFT_403336 [Aspergillus crustosus]
MAANAPGRSHLDLEQITDDTTELILRDLGQWLRDKAEFEKEGDNLRKCVDKGLEKACEPLINLLKADNKIKFRQWGYTVLRTGPGAARFHNKKGSASIVPVRIVSGRPVASGVELRPGWTLYITGEVEVSAGIDGLFIAELD